MLALSRRITNCPKRVRGQGSATFFSLFERTEKGNLSTYPHLTTVEGYHSCTLAPYKIQSLNVPSSSTKKSIAWARTYAQTTISLSSTTPNEEEPRSEPSLTSSTTPMSSLGLFSTLVQPHLETLQQLPEIQSYLSQQQSSSTDSPMNTSSTAVQSLEQLQRAVQVFEGMGPGNPYHTATLSLLAQCQLDHAFYDETLDTLNQLATYAASWRIPLAQSQVSWLAGQWEDSLLSAKKALAALEQQSPNDVLKLANAKTAETLAHWLLSDLSDLEEIRKALQSMTDLLQQASCSPPASSEEGVALACATAAVYCNLGVLDFIAHQERASGEHGSGGMEAALQAWNEGLSLLDRAAVLYKNDSNEESVSYPYLDWIRVKLHSNLAAGILVGLPDDHNLEKDSDSDDLLKSASEHASMALSIVDTLQPPVLPTKDYQFALGRSLRYVAACYRRADAAVTSEGLLQSAVDALRYGSRDSGDDHGTSRKDDSLVTLELRDAYQEAAILYSNWDKREKDAENWTIKSQQANDRLPAAWRGKASIYSGLCFGKIDTLS